MLGDPRGIRTPGLLLRRQLLYPLSYRAICYIIIALLQLKSINFREE